jgi:hypothetical protein
MKRFLIIGILLSFTCLSFSQTDRKIKKDNRYSFNTIKIQEGFQSITFQREGLIYWKNPFLAEHLPEEERIEKAKFIPTTELNGDKLLKITQYLNKHQLHKINKIEIPEGTFPSTGFAIFISFIEENTRTYSYFIYQICDRRIDTFIQMMNELIPEEDREEFKIRLRCK